jgi:hypothetical protein
MSLNLKSPEIKTSAASVPASVAHSRVDVEQLIALSIRGLGPMFNGEKRQFCHRVVRTPSGLMQEGLSPRYTVMTLLGLCEFEKAGGVSPFPISALLDDLLQNKQWPEGAGDFGLLLWLASVRYPEKTFQLFERFNLADAFTRCSDLRQGRTMEVAWLLIGLSYAALSQPARTSDLFPLALKAYEILIQNQNEGGFFGHLNATTSSAGKLRGWLGSFADQVYPIIALTRFSEAFQRPEALERALACGIGICRAQGPLGQWWWHYDSRAGKVASMYPVFSVHQEGMAPMALFALGEATGHGFDEAIYRGLEWIGSANELNVDMRDFSKNVVWRRIHPVPEFSMKVDVALSHLRAYRDASHRHMEILHECRPYELGWLLYAFAGRTGKEEAE